MLRDDKDFFDVTLACDDDQIQAHKVILSACYVEMKIWQREMLKSCTYFLFQEAFPTEDVLIIITLPKHELGSYAPPHGLQPFQLQLFFP